MGAKVEDEKKIYSLDLISIFLQDKNLYYVAKKSGVSYPVLNAIKNKTRTNYYVSKLAQISNYMKNYMSINKHVNSDEVKDED